MIYLDEELQSAMVRAIRRTEGGRESAAKEWGIGTTTLWELSQPSTVGRELKAGTFGKIWAKLVDSDFKKEGGRDAWLERQNLSPIANYNIKDDETEWLGRNESERRLLGYFRQLSDFGKKHALLALLDINRREVVDIPAEQNDDEKKRTGAHQPQPEQSHSLSSDV